MNAAATALLVLSLGSPLLRADHLALHNGDTLTGSIIGIGEGGRLSFDSPNAAAPLQLRGSALAAIDFQFTPPKDIPQSERIHLQNGDVLPGEILGLNKDSLNLRTWACGDLHIPRSVIASVDFGVAPHDLVFQGPQGAEGWSDNENWTFEEHALTASSRGTIARRKILPEQFILRFRLDWESNPNFKLYFCDDLLESSGDTDRYYFEINTGGLQLKRQAADSKRRWYSLYSSEERRPDTFPDNGMEVELRVDRKHRLIYIYINGEDEGHHHDPIGEIPTGSGIMLESMAGGDMKNIVSSIEIYNWDAISQIHRSEGHKNTDVDAVITTESERYEGIAEALVGTGADRVVLLKNAHSDNPMRIPFGALSVLYFRQASVEAASTSEFSLNMAARGRLALNNPTLTADSLTIEHPLLGQTTIRRDALMSMVANPPPASEPSE